MPTPSARKFSFAGGSHPGAPAALNTNWYHPTDRSICGISFLHWYPCTWLHSCSSSTTREIKKAILAADQLIPASRSRTMSEGGQLPWKVQKIDESRGPGEYSFWFNVSHGALSLPSSRIGMRCFLQRTSHNSPFPPSHSSAKQHATTLIFKSPSQLPRVHAGSKTRTGTGVWFGTIPTTNPRESTSLRWVRFGM